MNDARCRATPSGKPRAASYADAIRQALLDHFAASVVLVDRKGHVLQFHGQTGKYLNMPTGEPSLNLLDMAKEGLSLQLRSALHQAIEGGKTVVLDGSGLARRRRLRASVSPSAPVAQRGEAEPLLAVIFEDVPRAATAGADVRSRAAKRDLVRRTRR